MSFVTATFANSGEKRGVASVGHGAHGLGFETDERLEVRSVLLCRRCSVRWIDVRVETVVETTEFGSGAALRDWLVSSNPIVEEILAGLDLTDKERGTVEEALETLVRERAAGDATAILRDPVNIGIGSVAAHRR